MSVRAPRHRFLLGDDLNLLGFAEMTQHNYESAVGIYQEAGASPVDLDPMRALVEEELQKIHATR